MTVLLTSAVLIAALVSAGVIMLVLPALRRLGVLDIPVGRSLHLAPTPRGGGVGIAVAVILISTVLHLAVEDPQLTMAVHWSAVAVLLLLAAVGLSDDVRSLRPAPRFLAQILVAVAWGAVAVTLTGRHLVWIGIIALVAVFLVNATNFMDGTNGLASGHAVVASAWYLVVALQLGTGTAAILAAAVMGGSLGFLPFNVPRAHVFLGDVGSYALGGAWAVLSVWLFLSGAPLETVVAPLLLVVTDVSVTMLRRLLHGDPLVEPHRLHVYQRLAHAGWPHLRVALLFSGFTALACLMSLPALLGASRPIRLVMVLAMAGVAVGYHNLTRRNGGLARWHRIREELGL